MSFVTTEYLIFLPFVFFLVYFLPKNKSWIIILFANIFFAGFNKPKYLFILLISITVNFLFGLIINIAPKKKIYLRLGILFNTSYIIFIKYLLYPNGSLNSRFTPLGISFYSMQNMSYLFQVKNKIIKTEKNLFRYAAFISFFPQLLVGPIEKANSLLTQFRKGPEISDEKITYGFRLILWGLFKKIVISNNILIFSNDFYNHYQDTGCLSTLGIVVMYFFQLYCDLSGYTDIARGSASILGYSLSRNFNFPFLISSVGEFWRKWHITLSDWFNDYVYKPAYLWISKLKFQKRLPDTIKYKISYIIAISTTFILLGMWHNFTLNFLIVGILQSLFLSLELVFSFKLCKKRELKILNNIYPLVALIITMIFFFSKDIHQSFCMIFNIVSLKHEHYNLFNLSIFKIILFITFTLLVEYPPNKLKLYSILNNVSIYIRWSLYFIIILTILYFGNFIPRDTFIYSKF